MFISWYVCSYEETGWAIHPFEQIGGDSSKASYNVLKAFDYSLGLSYYFVKSVVLRKVLAAFCVGLFFI
jgi:hypothetical protein